MIRISTHRGRPFGAPLPADPGRAGMTLLEVMIALGILTMLTVAFLSSALATVHMNRVTELEVAGTNTITAQLDAMIAASRESDNRNEVTARSSAVAMVYYLRRVMDNTSDMGRDYPIQVSLDQASGVLTYQFPVSNPDELVGGHVISSTRTVAQNQSRQARGVVYVYLRERNIPARFYQWLDLQDAGGGETSTASEDATFFDMNGDGSDDGDFTRLMTASESVGLFEDADFQFSSLPITIHLRYYGSPGNMARDTTDNTPGFNTTSDNSLVSLTRSFIINDASVILPQ